MKLKSASSSRCFFATITATCKSCFFAFINRTLLTIRALKLQYVLCGITPEFGLRSRSSTRNSGQKWNLGWQKIFFSPKGGYSHTVHINAGVIVISETIMASNSL